jgi:hypothetical protein
MLKKPTSFVLASLRGSTYKVQNDVRLTSSLTAALLDRLFEQPANKKSRIILESTDQIEERIGKPRMERG